MAAKLQSPSVERASGKLSENLFEDVAAFLHVQHRDWRESFRLNTDATFEGCELLDRGEWRQSHDSLTLDWGNSQAQTLKRDGPCSYRNEQLTARLCDWQENAAPSVADPFTDMAMIVCYRASTGDREKNLLAFLRYAAAELGDAEVVLVEQDSQSRVNRGTLTGNVQHFFVENAGPFNRAWAFNVGAMASRRGLLFFSDIDAIVPRPTMRLAVRCLTCFDVVKPYSRFVLQRPEATELFHDTLSTSVFTGEGPTMWPILCSGSVLMTRKALVDLGGWCEEFVGWGAEDNAQDAKIMNLVNWLRLPGSGFHMHHARTTADGPHHGDYQANRSRLDYISRLSRPSLRAYIRLSSAGIGNPRRYAGGKAAEESPRRRYGSEGSRADERIELALRAGMARVGIVQLSETAAELSDVYFLDVSQTHREANPGVPFYTISTAAKDTAVRPIEFDYLWVSGMRQDPGSDSVLDIWITRLRAGGVIALSCSAANRGGLVAGAGSSEIADQLLNDDRFEYLRTVSSTTLLRKL
jgi:hypothetical protein